MEKIKFRQPLYFWSEPPLKGKFMLWHYWGDVDGGFISPVNGNLKRNSQQYIGLKDRNGKEIYKGDFVKPNFSGENHEVVWRDCSWFILNPRGNGIRMGDSICTEIEIIGNTTENPELLEEVL